MDSSWNSTHSTSSYPPLSNRVDDDDLFTAVIDTSRHDNSSRSHNSSQPHHPKKRRPRTATPRRHRYDSVGFSIMSFWWPTSYSKRKHHALWSVCAWCMAALLMTLQVVNLGASLRVVRSTEVMVKRFLIETGLEHANPATSATVSGSSNHTNTTTTTTASTSQSVVDLVSESLAQLFQQVPTPQPQQQQQQQQQHANNPKDYQLQLKVPFYIYETPELDWSAARRFRYHKWEELDHTTYPQYKHSDDYWMLQAARQHPMRVLTPQDAVLFFVPTLLNAWNLHNSWNATFCVGTLCDDELLQQADIALSQSEWFQRHQGRDHVIVDSHFLKRAWWVPGRPQQSALFYHCNVIHFEDKLPTQWVAQHSTGENKRIALPSMYVGHACAKQPAHQKSHDFAMIARFKRDNPNFADRYNVCHWLSQAGNYTVSRCGTGPQCPALAQARYGFHVRGDTFGANRLMDTLLSGSVPLFTAPEQYAILPEFVPWHEVGYFVNLSSRQAMEASLQPLVALPLDDYQRKLDLIEQYMPLLDHRQVGQFDAYMAQFAMRLGYMEMDPATTTTFNATAAFQKS